jgi:hypothetical protein
VARRKNLLIFGQYFKFSWDLCGLVASYMFLFVLVTLTDDSFTFTNLWYFLAIFTLIRKNITVYTLEIHKNLGSDNSQGDWVKFLKDFVRNMKIINKFKKQHKYCWI